MPAADLDWALHQFRESDRLAEYELADAYYAGAHETIYDDRRFRSVFSGFFRTVRLNVCQLVVNAMTDRLEVEGFETPGADQYAKRANELWMQNRMDLVANEIHREAFKKGDAYVIVQPDSGGTPVFWCNKAQQVAVAYSDTDPGVIERAAKLWAGNDGMWRLNLYYPDRIERYMTDRPGREIYGDMRPDYLQPYQPNALQGEEIINWDYGQVPVFHFSNQALYEYGSSELSEVIPLQKTINKIIHDLLITSEYSSFRQRYAIGVDPEEADSNWKSGVDRIFTFANENVRVGEFNASDLPQFLQVIDSFRRHVAVVSAVPLHYLYETAGDFPSGDALKTAEARFDKKLKDRQTAFGNVWEQVVRYALAVDGDAVPAKQEIRTSWTDTAPRSLKEEWEVALLKKAAGVPVEQVLKEQGYTPEQAQQFAEQLLKEAKAAAPAGQMAAPTAGVPVDSQPEGEKKQASVVMPTASGRISVDRINYASGG